MKRWIIFIILLINIFTINIYAEDLSTTERAVVLEAEKINNDLEVNEMMEQNVKLKIKSGVYKGQIFEIINHLSGNSIYDINVNQGDKVVVVIETLEDGNIDIAISDYERQNYILYLSILFIILLILIGKTKGLKAVITLSLTMIGILKILLPLILKGVNPIPITIVISVVITILTVFIIGGINSKSIAAIIGTSSGVIIAGLIAYMIGSQVKLTGLSSEEAAMLMYIPQGIKFNFKSLLFSGIIMGALGAVMDIGMSISSAMEEVYKNNPSITKKELFSSGMNIGKDVMGTMTNTLILAYTGSSIPLLLLFMAYETSIIKILNLDIIATEVIRSLAGSIGLVITIPITAFIASILMKREDKK